MKRTFCDCCGEEFDIRDELTSPFVGRRIVAIGINGERTQRIEVEVAVSVAPTDDDERFDICGKCRWAAVDQADPRPQPTRAA